MTKVGDRIGAILSADRHTKIVKFLGYGLYEGEFPLKISDDFTIGNPRLKLDSGETAWGAEVWWRSEEKMKSDLESYIEQGYTIENTSIEAERRKARGEEVN